MMAVRPVINKNVRFASRPEGAVLLQLDRGKYKTLNVTGRVIWDELCRGGTTDEVADALHARYPTVPKTRIENDLNAFLRELERRGLISLESDG
ncbi:MAG: hypothetical protein QOH21_1441 [Acidobacteriota bacterium]|jgi:hypothetical protein|nr:hypothetical protein [Acidobacteriota bacterium]